MTRKITSLIYFAFLLVTLLTVSLVNILDVETVQASVNFDDGADLSKILTELGDTNATFVGLSRLPYNLDITLEQYQAKLYTYWIVSGTNDVVMIEPNTPDVFYQKKSSFSTNILDLNAQKFIAIASKGMALDEFDHMVVDKEQVNFFFRWTDKTRRLPVGGHPFVQVAYSIGGDFLTYVNTFHMVRDVAKQYTTEHEATLNFSEIYSNGGSKWGWLKTGSSYYTVNNDGYCYDAGWCSPKNIYWSYATKVSTQERIGRWYPNANSSSLAAVYVPANNATHPTARYYVRDYYGESYKVVNQSIWYDTWVIITNESKFNINRIKVGTGNWDATNPPKLAWDEVWIYDAPQ